MLSVSRDTEKGKAKVSISSVSVLPEEGPENCIGFIFCLLLECLLKKRWMVIYTLHLELSSVHRVAL